MPTLTSGQFVFLAIAVLFVIGIGIVTIGETIREKNRFKYAQRPCTRKDEGGEHGDER